MHAHATILKYTRAKPHASTHKHAHTRTHTNTPTGGGGAHIPRCLQKQQNVFISSMADLRQSLQDTDSQGDSGDWGDISDDQSDEVECIKGDVPEEDWGRDMEMDRGEGEGEGEGDEEEDEEEGDEGEGEGDVEEVEEDWGDEEEDGEDWRRVLDNYWGAVEEEEGGEEVEGDDRAPSGLPLLVRIPLGLQIYSYMPAQHGELKDDWEVSQFIESMRDLIDEVRQRTYARTRFLYDDFATRAPPLTPHYHPTRTHRHTRTHARAHTHTERDTHTRTNAHTHTHRQTHTRTRTDRQTQTYRHIHKDTPPPPTTRPPTTTFTSRHPLPGHTSGRHRLPGHTSGRQSFLEVLLSCMHAGAQGPVRAASCFSNRTVTTPFPSLKNSVFPSMCVGSCKSEETPENSKSL